MLSISTSSLRSQRRIAAMAAVAIGFCLGATASGAAGELTIRVTGIKAAAGAVRVAVYARSGDFPDESAAIAKAAIAAVIPEIRHGFELPPGRYAVAVFHDRNGNERLDENFVGVPKEPYGFSNNVRGRLRAPSFAEAAFALGADPLDLAIEIR